jgi:hypothetical protein
MRRPFGPRHVWRVEQIGRHRRLAVQATQLDDRGITKRSEARAVLQEWIDHLSGLPTHVEEIDFVSRVPQELLSAVAGQTQLVALAVKWGPYADLEPLTALRRLEQLSLDGATAVVDLGPLAHLHTLHSLGISSAHRVTDFSPLAALSRLRNLSIGGYIGSDRVVHLPDLSWLASMRELRSVHFGGTRIEPDQLAVLLELPELVTVTLPLRRSYRKLVASYAETSAAFAGVERDYREYEGYRDGLR